MFSVFNFLCVNPLYVFGRLVHPRYQVLRCLIPVGPMAPARLLPFSSRTRLHHYRNATILLLGKWALVIGLHLMILLKLATDCPITTRLLLQAPPHHRLHLQMGRSKMTPALSKFIFESFTKHLPSVL